MPHLSHSRVLAATALVAVLALAGCGADDDPAAGDLPALEQSDAGEASSDDSTGTTGDGTDEPDADLAMAQFQQCMKENGVDIELDGQGGMQQSFTSGAGGDEADAEAAAGAAFEDAEAACEHFLDGAFGTIDDLSAEEQAEIADANLAFEQCLHDKGFDVDVDPNGAFMLGPEIDFDDFNAAAEECQPTASEQGGGN